VAAFGVWRSRQHVVVIREPSYGDCTQWQARFIPFDQAFLDPARVYLRLDSRRYRFPRRVFVPSAPTITERSGIIPEERNREQQHHHYIRDKMLAS